MSTVNYYNIAIFRFLTENDVFDLEKDLEKVAPENFADEEIERATALLSAVEFEKKGVLKRLDLRERTVFVLTKPFDSFSQTVELNSKTVAGLALFLNQYAAESGQSECEVNPLKVEEENIRMLICVAASLQEKLKEAQQGPQEPWMQG